MIFMDKYQFHVMKALVGAFYNEKALVGAFSGHCDTSRRFVQSSRYYSWRRSASLLGKLGGTRKHNILTVIVDSWTPSAKH